MRGSVASIGTGPPPRLTTKLLVAGHLLLWVGESVLQVVPFVRFLLLQKRIRRRFHRLISGADSD